MVFSKTLFSGASSRALATLGVLVLVFGLASCKKDDGPDDNNNNNQPSDKALFIENGGLALAPGGSATYRARFVDRQGVVTYPASVTWSVGESGVATISSSGVLTPTGVGVTTVKASVTEGNKTYTAEAPLSVSTPAVFAVGPSAIICQAGDEIPLAAVYLSPNAASVTYSYTSSNASVASVSGAGVVRGAAPGLCSITVTATNLQGNPSVIVPVWVVGPPAVPLPVTRVQVTPASKEIFRNDEFTFTAKAFNSSGAEVSKPFIWQVTDPKVASIDGNGRVRGLTIGETKIQAIADGVIGEAYLTVLPDTFVLVEPIYASIAPGRSRQFTAKAYNARNNQQLAVSNFVWKTIPPIPGFSQFNVGTVDQTGTFRVNADAIQGNSTVVLASVGGSETAEGVATIIVGVAIGDDCGADVPGGAGIRIKSPTTVNLSLFSGQITSQIDAVAIDAQGNELPEVTLRYSSDNATAAIVSSSGMVTGSADGTANITVCVGSVSATVVVRVSL